MKEELQALIDKVYNYGWQMGSKNQTDGTWEEFNLAKAMQELDVILEKDETEEE